MRSIKQVRNNKLEFMGSMNNSKQSHNHFSLEKVLVCGLGVAYVKYPDDHTTISVYSLFTYLYFLYFQMAIPIAAPTILMVTMTTANTTITLTVVVEGPVCRPGLGGHITVPQEVTASWTPFTVKVNLFCCDSATLAENCPFVSEEHLISSTDTSQLAVVHRRLSKAANSSSTYVLEHDSKCHSIKDSIVTGTHKDLQV